MVNGIDRIEGTPPIQKILPIPPEKRGKEPPYDPDDPKKPKRPLPGPAAVFEPSGGESEVDIKE